MNEDCTSRLEVENRAILTLNNSSNNNMNKALYRERNRSLILSIVRCTPYLHFLFLLRVVLSHASSSYASSGNEVFCFWCLTTAERLATFARNCFFPVSIDASAASALPHVQRCCYFHFPRTKMIATGNIYRAYADMFVDG